MAFWWHTPTFVHFVNFVDSEEEIGALAVILADAARGVDGADLT
jgi:hypothetical protein